MARASIEQLVNETLQCVRAGRWAEYRGSLGTLREALLDRAGEEEEVRRHLDILAAAAPEHDASGCIAEVEALADCLRRRPDLLGAGVPRSEPALDLRGLQPPEPIVRIFAALERAPRTPLRVILPHEPLPLYNLLRQRGFRYSGAARADGGFELLIESG